MLSLVIPVYNNEENIPALLQAIAGIQREVAGDFDVGKNGLGEMNFTADFSHTDEFRRLINLGYVDIRYTDSNQLGVRYEPWHIKLACDHHDHTCA